MKVVPDSLTVYAVPVQGVSFYGVIFAVLFSRYRMNYDRRSEKCHGAMSTEGRSVAPSVTVQKLHWYRVNEA